MARILIIDDDPDMVLATRICLERAGHQVYVAANGEQGLAMARSERPDLIVLDVMMDTTTEGIQVALRMRSPAEEDRDLAQIPILMLTSLHATAPRRIAPDADYLPVDAFLDKPIEPETLLAEVEKLLTPK